MEEKILNAVSYLVNNCTDGDTLPQRLIEALLNDHELEAIQNYANTVSITRVGLNDHGPVHMKKVCYNAIKMLRMLHEADIPTSLENELSGTFADSLCAVMIAALMHDSGMTIARKNHELYSGIVVYALIDRILLQVLPDDSDTMRRVIIRSLAMEGIIGHMGTNPIHSVEAGIILIADGLDMTKGRARIPMNISTQACEGDIHKYSANAIEQVKIIRGEERPIRIEIYMKSEVGFFQVEAVLIPKIQSSPAKHLLELHAGVIGQDLKRYR